MKILTSWIIKIVFFFPYSIWPFFLILKSSVFRCTYYASPELKSRKKSQLQAPMHTRVDDGRRRRAKMYKNQIMICYFLQKELSLFSLFKTTVLRDSLSHLL